MIMEEENKSFDLQKIKDLINLMEAHNLTEIEVVKGDEKIVLKRGINQVLIPSSAIEQHSVKNGNSGEKFEFIKSQFPGTFYAATSPDSEPFVKVGSEVTPETTVCIIDAMKVINEIKAEITGTISEILAKNGQTVEYGTLLFKVRVK